MKVILPALREGVYAGVGLSLLVAVYLLWLWQPERQVLRHSETLIRAVEQRNFTRAESLMAPEFRDQWGDDRVQVVQRMREVFRYLRDIRLSATDVSVRNFDRGGVWSARIIFDAEPNEVTTEIQRRVNSLSTPFELEWRRVSGRPWDWKLVSVANSTLDIPADF